MASFRPEADVVVGRIARGQINAGVGSGGAKLAETLYLYDGQASWDAPPLQGYLTQVRRWLDREDRYVTRMGYDQWGNQRSDTDEPAGR